MRINDNSNYPVNAFPLIARDAALEIHNNMGSPIPLIMISMLGQMSLAFQDKVDVCRMNGLASPCSLYVLSIAESGERKTATDKPLIKPFRDFEESQAIAMKPEFDKYRAEKSAWEEEKKGIQLAIRINAKNGESTDELKQSLAELESKEPIEPKAPKMIYSDTTTGALQLGIEKLWRSVGIMSDEGGIIFDSRAMQNLAIYNKFWDGDPLTVDRIARESLNIKNGRLTISIAVQPKTLDKFLKNQGKLSRDNGFLARFLIAYPYSTQGTRFIHNPNPSWQYVNIQQNHIAEILKNTKSETEQNSGARITLNFSPDAQSKWIDFHNRVELELSAGGYLFDVKDAGAKIADNLARVAGLFHCMEGNHGDISLDTMTRAAAVCEWHLHEFKRLFGVQPELPIEISDANELEKWIFNLCLRYPGWTEIGKNVIAQLGPNQLRGSKIRREPVVHFDFLRTAVALHPDTGALEVSYSIEQCVGMSDELHHRLKNHLTEFDLHKKYAKQVNIHLSEHQFGMTMAFESGAHVLRNYLTGTADAHKKNFGANDWRTALFRGLALCDGFCNGGFKKALGKTA